MAAPPPEPTRPLLRWHGGKWRLAPWIVRHFPAHRTYIEPFGGGGSVLLRKPRVFSELYNDLDGDVVNLFRVLRSRRAAELIHRLTLTPFARDEYLAAYEPAEDEVERARRLLVRSFMGRSSNSHSLVRARGRSGFRRMSGYRSKADRNCTTPSRDWANYADALPAIIERLRGVAIEQCDGRDLLRTRDHAGTLFYVDPPYLPSTRTTDVGYAHELTEDAQAELLELLDERQGFVVLSGYPSELYDRRLAHWLRVEAASMADGALPRTEVLWINPRAAARLSAFGSVLAQAQLFEVRP
ncbi:DNA adenine methylase [Methylobacterium nodulans]|uniref:D12 class N6 adenine-specific DNA methyltransferase n=1 Tax=Methylobacterium nodulans (strain LMG 21967 / CNCM I-2342 / ORS 2060) TaxID=460265 RepID=B8IE63_METNO|nr:DNA adenine methylase [Methylobacterium nodulans]ACL57609.1 D12 class N6 adenine-specific DNA methyltransferase [Methylobacterium nodulans ORS 2060]